MIEAGRTLLHYRLVEKIGEGGMGVVWKAIDTTLDRPVAIKILPSQLAGDTDRLARFEREAKLLAALNHSNIASIYGLHRDRDVNFLAMELVEGEDLAQRLARGPLDRETTLDVARQVCDALQSAHDKGVVHRDLKPANIRMTPDGQIKVLDFGLAKALAPEPVSGDIAASPTLTSAGTVAGVILGTAAYMSPEQARGKPLDQRTDMWSFGCVVWECLTGESLFRGETVSDSIGAILRMEPDMSKLPADTPVSIRRMLRRCMSRDPAQRLHHAADARIEIDEAGIEIDAPVPDATPAAAAVAEPSWKRGLPWAVATIAMVAVVVLLLRSGGQTGAPDDPVTYRFSIRLPADPGSMAPPELSPDGRMIAFQSSRGDGPRRVWIRPLADEQAHPLEGTEEIADRPFWAPDSRSLLYFTDETLERVGLEGAPPETVCRVPRGWRNGSMARDGSVLFEVNVNPEALGWYLLRPGAREAEKIERPLPVEEGQSISWPTFMPDGRHVVFIQTLDGTKRAVLTDLESGSTQPMFRTDARVRVAADGYYMFLRKGVLLAQGFDPPTYEPVGEPKQLASGVRLFEPNGRAAFGVSNSGSVAYTGWSNSVVISWFDRSGNELEQALEPDFQEETRLSPDGRFAALIVRDPSLGVGDLWVHDLERGTSNRLTNTPYSEFGPVWSRDGKRLAYSADVEGPPNLHVADVESGETRELLPFDGQVQSAWDWSLDDDKVLFSASGPGREHDIFEVDVDGGDPEVLVQADGVQTAPALSPDGRWLAYMSTETGRAEVYVRPYGRQGPRRLVSVDGGWAPSWDGSERLVYQAPGDTLLIVDLAVEGNGLRIGRPDVLLRLQDGDLVDYGLAPDGRLLVARRPGVTDEREVHLVVGW